MKKRRGTYLSKKCPCSVSPPAVTTGCRKAARVTTDPKKGKIVAILTIEVVLSVLEVKLLNVGFAQGMRNQGNLGMLADGQCQRIIRQAALFSL